MAYPVFQLNLTVAPFPTGWSGDLNAYANQLVALITASLSGSILYGLYNPGLPLPTSDQGPIFQSQQLYLWSPTAAAYVLYNSQSVAYARSPSILDNADFQVNQRNPALSSTPNVAALSGSVTPNSFSNYLTDRWIVIQDGSLSTAPTQSVVSAGPFLGGGDHPNTLNCLRITAGGSAVTLSAGSFCVAMQRIELQRARTIFDVTPSISVWLRSSVIGTFCVFLQNATGGESIVFPCAVTVANVFQKFTFPAIVTPPYGAGGFGTNPTDWSMTFGVCAASGGTYQGAPGSDGTWQAATRYADSNQLNLLATSGATLDISLPQVEPAGQVSAFDFKNFQDSLFACQYMFSKSMGYSRAPGTGTSGGYVPNTFYAFSSSIAYGLAKFPRNMRIAPVVGGGLSSTGITLYSPGTGSTVTQAQWTGGTGVAVSFGTTGKLNILEWGFTEIDSAALFSVAVSSSFLNNYLVDWTASSDL